MLLTNILLGIIIFILVLYLGGMISFQEDIKEIIEKHFIIKKGE